MAKNVIYAVLGLFTILLIWLTGMVAFDMGGFGLGVASILFPIISQLILAGILLSSVGWMTFHSFLVVYVAVLTIGLGIAKLIDELGPASRPIGRRTRTYQLPRIQSSRPASRPNRGRSN